MPTNLANQVISGQALDNSHSTVSDCADVRGHTKQWAIIAIIAVKTLTFEAVLSEVTELTADGWIWRSQSANWPHEISIKEL